MISWLICSSANRNYRSTSVRLGLINIESCHKSQCLHLFMRHKHYSRLNQSSLNRNTWKPSVTSQQPLNQSLTESVGVERQTLELQEVSNGSRKDLDLVPGQIHCPQVTGEPLQLLRKLEQQHKQQSSQRPTSAIGPSRSLKVVSTCRSRTREWKNGGGRKAETLSP